MFYPAYIHSDLNGSASGFFLMCQAVFAGDSLDDAFQDARAALTAHFETLFESEEELPLPGMLKRILKQLQLILSVGSGCWWTSI
jgi:predicted RNase H-like HicB family nuclease